MAHVTLRAMEPADADLIYVWENDWETWCNGSAQMGPLALSDVKAFVVSRPQQVLETGQMRLMVDADGETVGCVDVFEFSVLNRNCQIGIFIDKRFRNKGFATEAVRQLCCYLKQKLQVAAVGASVLASNGASRKVFEHAGFEQIGIRRSWYVVDGGAREDEILFELL